jgi:hypothetical protein
MIQINLAHDAPDISASRIPLVEILPPGVTELHAGASGPFIYELQLGEGLTVLLDEWQAADVMSALQGTGLTV